MFDDTKSPPRAPIDLAALRECCMDNAQLAALVLEKFETQLRGDLPGITRAVAAGEMVAAARACHALKGAAAAVAAGAVRDVAARMEAAGKGADLEALRASVEALRGEIERCLAYLPTARAVFSGEAGGESA